MSGISGIGTSSKVFRTLSLNAPKFSPSKTETTSYLLYDLKAIKTNRPMKAHNAIRRIGRYLIAKFQ